MFYCALHGSRDRPNQTSEGTKKGQTHRYMYGKAGIRWSGFLDGEAPAAWKLSELITCSWTERWMSSVQLNKEVCLPQRNKQGDRFSWSLQEQAPWSCLHVINIRRLGWGESYSVSTFPAHSSNIHTFAIPLSLTWERLCHSDRSQALGSLTFPCW